MNKIRLSSGSQIKDPILSPLIEKSTKLILASINQQLLAKADKVNFKYQTKKLKVGGTRKVSFNTSGSVILKQIQPEKRSDFSNLATNLARETMIEPMSSPPVMFGRFRPSFVIPPVVSFNNLKLKESVLNNKQLIQKAFSGIAVSKLTKNYVEKFLATYQGITEETDNDTIVQNKGIKFRVHEVKCVDETNPEWPGSDEIAMGGVFLDPEGNTSTQDEFRVRNGYDDGDVKRYNPPRILESFNVTNSNDIQTYSAVITLAEKDGGGFSGFLNDLYEAIKSELQVILTALGAAAGTWIGGQIGGAVGTAVGGPLGTVIGIAAGAILGAIIGALISAFKDDIFDPQMATIALPSSNASFQNNRLTSPIDVLHFRGHGGHYAVKYDWQIIR